MRGRRVLVRENDISVSGLRPRGSLVYEEAELVGQSRSHEKVVGKIEERCGEACVKKAS
jgi:hypothetical protein